MGEFNSIPTLPKKNYNPLDIEKLQTNFLSNKGHKLDYTLLKMIKIYELIWQNR